MSSGGTTSPLAAPSGTYYWFAERQADVDTTIGFNFKQTGLFKSKLDLVGDLTFTRNNTAQSVGLGGTPTATITNCALSTSLICGDIPDVYNKMTQFRLTGNYHVDKKSKVVVSYLYQKLATNDYYYNGYQVGYTSAAQLPTNEQNPDYKVQAVSVSYVYSFQ